MTDTKTKLYIANLGKYNEGELDGAWINLPYDDDQWENLMLSIHLAHRDENGDYVEGYEEDGIVYEEFAIHDYESEIPGFRVPEYTNPSSINDLIAEIEDLDEWDYETFTAILEAETDDLQQALNITLSGDATFYSGVDSLEDLAMQFADEGILSKEFLLDHIDWEGVARDMSFDGYTETSGGVLWYA